MSDAPHILHSAVAGDRNAAADLLPLVYDELRKLAVTRMAAEKPEDSLQATALVHEVYLRLVNVERFTDRNHLLAVAADVIRHILIDRARSKGREKRGGGRKRFDLRHDIAVHDLPPDDLIDLTTALDDLAREDVTKAELVKLRFFGRLTVQQAAEVLGISRATADRHWAYSRAWLHVRLSSSD